MDIHLKLQLEKDNTLPLMPTRINTGSALPLTVKDVPSIYAGGILAGVAVTVTNADGVAITGDCEQADGADDWTIIFASSNFATYGTVKYGIKITLTFSQGEKIYPVVFAGDFEVVQASVSAMPGDPTASYVTKGGDQYLKTQVVDDVQHYTKLSMVNHEQLGWTLTTDGDYILVDGEFVEAE